MYSLFLNHITNIAKLVGMLEEHGIQFDKFSLDKSEIYYDMSMDSDEDPPTTPIHTERDLEESIQELDVAAEGADNVVNELIRLNLI